MNSYEAIVFFIFFFVVFYTFYQTQLWIYHVCFAIKRMPISVCFTWKTILIFIKVLTEDPLYCNVMCIHSTYILYEKKRYNNNYSTLLLCCCASQISHIRNTKLSLFLSYKFPLWKHITDDGFFFDGVVVVERNGIYLNSNGECLSRGCKCE